MVNTQSRDEKVKMGLMAGGVILLTGREEKSKVYGILKYQSSDLVESTQLLCCVEQ